jgi:MFS family permease
VFPAPPYLWLTVLLLFIRAGLNNMDQPPRSAFIAGVVRPDERTAAMGITTIVRTLAAMTGPTVTGILAGQNNFWIAFILAGTCRIAYDIGLYVLFINVKLYQHEGGNVQAEAASPRLSDEEMTELDDLHSKSDSDTGTSKIETPEGSLDTRLAPQDNIGVRRRSPSPLKRSA